MFTYAWVLWISTMGGIVSFMRNLLKKRVREFSLVEFIAQCTTSAFSGVIAFWFCQWAIHAINLDQTLVPAFVGLAGHMGNRFLSLAEEWFSKKFKDNEK